MKISSSASFILCASALLSCGSIVSGYDINCIFPPGWFDNPFFCIMSMSFFFGEYVRRNSFETPVVIRLSHHSTMCRGLCLAYHDNDVFDPFDEAPTFVTVPPFGQNAYSTVMCIAQCHIHMFEGTFDMQQEAIDYYKDEYGMQLTKPRADIYDAWVEMNSGDSTKMFQIMENDDYHPYTMGHIAGFKCKAYADDDGWNSDGALHYDRATGETRPCTGSCRKYQDTVGYEPKPDPRIHTELSTDDPNDKYACTGYCRRWQPLQEGVDSGSLKRQEFITPHIGAHAKTYLRPVTSTLVDPQYDLKAESYLVIERLKNATTDQYQRDAIDVFDDKLKVREVISRGLRANFGETGEHSFQDEILFKVGLSMTEYDSIVQAWHEKKIHDLVRPTTVIKHWGDEDLYTFSGDLDAPAPAWIKARDFEAFIRVMPHAEYPSGSACLCTGYQEYADIFFETRYGRKLSGLTWGRGDRTYLTDNMDGIREACGQSRLWGGMHYTAAVADGEEICRGLGQISYDYVTRLKNGSQFNGGDGPWRFGDQANYNFGSCSGTSGKKGGK